jgi:hypothetical protein
MSPFNEPNAFEQAEKYLSDVVKKTRIVSADAEENLLKLLEYYFESRYNTSPSDRSKQWNEIENIILTLPEAKTVNK